jgi:hypothetical protein
MVILTNFIEAGKGVSGMANGAHEEDEVRIEVKTGTSNLIL